MNTIQIVRHRWAMGFGRAAVLHDLIIAGRVMLVLLLICSNGVMAEAKHVDTGWHRSDEAPPETPTAPPSETPTHVAESTPAPETGGIPLWVCVPVAIGICGLLGLVAFRHRHWGHI